MKPIFTVPKLIKPKDTSKGWYAYFRYNKELFRYKFSLNYIKDLSEREIEFNAACAILHKKLKDGWDPTVSEAELPKSNDTLTEALAFALGKKKLNVGLKTYQDYSCTIRFVNSAITELGLASLKIVDTKRIHIRLILDKVAKTRKWSNKAYNKNLGYFGAVLSELVEWEVIESNPANKIKTLPENDSEANLPASASDIEIIKKELSTNHKNFYIFVITIFHTGIRPAEILRIKLSMVSLKKSCFNLPSDITKNGKKRTVPINKHLLEFYKEMNFSDLPKEYYLFGTHRVFGKSRKKGDPDFVPGPRQVRRCSATRYWELVVKIYLKIEMNMYAMKHYGADQKILAGLSLDTLRELYGHASTLMTETYAKKVKEVYRRQILDQSPDF